MVIPNAGCAHAVSASAALASDSPSASAPARQYPPDRDVDILHLVLDVTPDFVHRTLSGRAELRFKPILEPLRELRLDAVDLEIDRVTAASATVQAWQNTGHELRVTFAEPIPTNREAQVEVVYHCEPANGLFFRTPEMGYKPGETHLFTQGEAINHRHWYPGYDAPDDKFTSEITCRVPEGMTVLANGRLADEQPNAAPGLHAVRWLQDKPHPNYLVALVAGYFQKVEDRHRDIPLLFYTLPSVIQEAPASFRGTREMMAFFEEETGVPYPWARYAQVCVNDFVAGGMENTTLTILTDTTLFPAESENIRTSEGLVAHELSHQWFGDLVTCKDWSHLWLNEGFATYYEALWQLHRHGRDEFLYSLLSMARVVLQETADTRSIVTRQFSHPDEQFGYLTYPKSAWVLHMLQSQLGPDLFRRCVRTYLDRHAFGLAETADLQRVIEEQSGRSFDRFFDQWLYHGHFPDLEVTYSWDQTTRLARLNIKQVQTLSDRVVLYQFPLPVRFTGPSGRHDETITVKEKEQDFHFPLPEAPEIVRLDPHYTVLAQVRFGITAPMAKAMLTNRDDLIGRVLAIQSLASRHTQDAVTQLRRVLAEDPFYGVRLEAAKALRQIHTDEALEALLASTDQADARVRLQVRQDLGSFFRESVRLSTLQALEKERNPDILAELIRTLGSYGDAAAAALVTSYLSTQSQENMLARAAIETLRQQGNPNAIRPVLDTLRTHEAAFSSDGYASSLHALAALAHDESNKDAVREFLVRHLSHPRRTLRREAIVALGELGDPQASGALLPFTRADKDNAERHAAEQALAALRAAKRPADNLGDLRREVLDLQKDNRELRRLLNELRPKAPETAPARAPEPTKPARKKKS